MMYSPCARPKKLLHIRLCVPLYFQNHTANSRILVILCLGGLDTRRYFRKLRRVQKAKCGPSPKHRYSDLSDPFAAWTEMHKITRKLTGPCQAHAHPPRDGSSELNLVNVVRVF
jgi:hypothetical protein